MMDSTDAEEGCKNKKNVNRFPELAKGVPRLVIGDRSQVEKAGGLES